jgi:hypothetical protein
MGYPGYPAPNAIPGNGSGYGMPVPYDMMDPKGDRSGGGKYAKGREQRGYNPLK